MEHTAEKLVAGQVRSNGRGVKVHVTKQDGALHLSVIESPYSAGHAISLFSTWEVPPLKAGIWEEEFPIIVGPGMK